MRHAKAETAVGDFDTDRPLSARGHADATAAGAWLGPQGLRPELVICSPSRRTRQTWHAVSVALNETAGDVPAPKVRYEPAAYGGGPADLIDLIRTAPESVATLLLVAHNPAISQLSMLLDPEHGMDSDGLRTCGIAVHRVASAWAACGEERVPFAGAHTARG